MCGYDLATSRLRNAGSRDEWARGVPAHRLRARLTGDLDRPREPRPGCAAAVYILSRREPAFVATGEDGRLEIPMMVGLSAPNAGRRAYGLALVVEDGSWRVDRVARVPIFDN